MYCSKRVVLSFLAFVVAGFIFSGCYGISFGINDYKAEASEDFQWEFEAAGLQSIDAATSNGEIIYHGVDGGRVNVHATLTVKARNESTAISIKEQTEVRAEKEGDVLRIVANRPKLTNINIMVRYEITGPPSLNLKFNTSNGRIEVAGHNAAIDAQTSNGRIFVRGSRGDINLNTSNGRIDLEDVRGAVEAHTSNGRINLVGDTDGVNLHTSNGKITADIGTLSREGIFHTSNGEVNVRVHDGNAPMQVKTSNGAVELAIPENFSGQVDAYSSSGKVETEIPVKIITLKKNHLVGELGNGGDSKIQVSTSNGKVHLMFAE